MKKLLASLAFAFAAWAASAQEYSDVKSNFTVEKNGGVVTGGYVDYSTSQTWPSALLPPCGSNGAPTWRPFCDGDGVLLSTGTTTGNPTITGKVTATNFEVPASGSTGYIGATGLGRLVFTTTDGRLAITKATADGIAELNIGGNATATNGRINCTASQCQLTAGGGSFVFPWQITNLRLGTTVDTAASVTLNTASSWSNLARTCDATSNTVAYTIPASTTTGSIILIKRHDNTAANTCTITRSSSDLIDGLTSITLAQQGDWVMLKDGSNSGNTEAWQIIGGNFRSVPNNTDGTVTCSDNFTTRNGAQLSHCTISELVTIAAAATTTTANNLLQANSTIMGVVVRNTVAIPTAATYQVGITGDAGRFCGTYGGSQYPAVAVAINTTSVCNNFNDPTGATATGGPNQPAAAAILITPNATPGTAAGRVRVTVFFTRLTVPAS